MSKMIDISGQIFGDLKVIRLHSKKGKRYMWECQCSCGGIIITRADSLKCGYTFRCMDCKRKAVSKFHSKHGMHDTRIYSIWEAMKERTSNKNCKAYKDYGARGILLCDEWKDFIPFYEWSKNNGYNDNLTIDRIDNSGNYEPNNCKWSTRAEQMRNTRRNVNIEYKGVTKVLTDWSKELNVPVNTLKRNIDKHGVEKAFIKNGISW